MADNGAGGFQAVNLPSNMPQYGETLQLGIQNSERQGEKILQLQEQRQRKAEQDRLQNLRYINSATDFDQYKTGEQHLDNYSQGQLKQIFDNAVTNYANLPQAEMELRLQNDLNPLFKWDIAAKNAYANGKQALEDVSKKYPNADPGVLRNTFHQSFVGDFLNPDGTRKNTDEIQPSDYSSVLQNKENLLPAINDVSPLQNYYHGLEKSMVHDSDYTSDKGFMHKDKWSAYVTPMTQVSFDAKGKPFVEPKSTTLPGVVDEDGNPMKVLDGKALNTMMSIPGVGVSLLKKWDGAKQSVEANYIKRTGRPLDATTEGLLFSHFAYQDAQQNLPHDVSFDEATKIPKPPTININTGLANTRIQDVYGEVSGLVNEEYNGALNRPNGVPLNQFSADTQQVILNYANKIIPHVASVGGLGQADVYVKKEPDGKIWLIKAGTGTPGVAGSEQKIAPLTYEDLNLAANKGVKATQKVLQEANKPSQQQVAPEDKYSQYKRH